MNDVSNRNQVVPRYHWAPSLLITALVAATAGCYTQLGFHYVEDVPVYEEVTEYVTEAGEDSVVESEYYYEDDYYYVRPRSYRRYFSTFYGYPRSSFSMWHDPLYYDGWGWGSSWSMSSCLFDCYYGFHDPWLYGPSYGRWGHSFYGYSGFGFGHLGVYGYAPYSRHGYYGYPGYYGYSPYSYYGVGYDRRSYANYRPRGSTLGRGGSGGVVEGRGRVSTFGIDRGAQRAGSSGAAKAAEARTRGGVAPSGNSVRGTTSARPRGTAVRSGTTRSTVGRRTTPTRSRGTTRSTVGRRTTPTRSSGTTRSTVGRSTTPTRSSGTTRSTPTRNSSPARSSGRVSPPPSRSGGTVSRTPTRSSSGSSRSSSGRSSSRRGN